MSELTVLETPEEIPVEQLSAAPPAVPRLERLLDSTLAVFAAFLLLGTVALATAWFTVHTRQPQELTKSAMAVRAQVMLSHWLEDGYFHYAGLINSGPKETSIDRNSTGAYMVSGFLVEKIFGMMYGRYSYRLLALHNQVLAMILSALAGLLSYRLARRFGLEARLAFAAGGAVVVVLFTFPESLQLYWSITAQAYGLLFALVYLILEERCLDRSPRPRSFLIAQAMAIFLMTAMEMIFALGFVASLAAVMVFLRRGASFRRFVLIVILPCVAALLLYKAQMAIANVPAAQTNGSTMMFRTGLDGDATYYGDHLDIAFGRAGARANFPANRQYIFRWPTVFFLGLLSIVATWVAFLRGRAPRVVLETLVALTGAWLLYASIFSQAIKIHPWIYDLLLFTPMAIAFFAIAPSLLESLTGRTGAVVLVIVFSAFWYSFFQLRLYALWYPVLPPPAVSAPAPH